MRQVPFRTQYNFYLVFLNLSLIMQGTTVLLPNSASDPASMISQALVVYKSLINNPSTDSPHQLSDSSHKPNDKEISQSSFHDSKPAKKNTTPEVPRFTSPKFSLQSHKED